MPDQTHLVIIVLGIFFIIVGISNLFRPVIDWMVKLGNIMGGEKTEITKGTYISSRIGAIIVILIGLFALYFAIRY